MSKHNSDKHTYSEHFDEHFAPDGLFEGQFGERTHLYPPSDSLLRSAGGDYPLKYPDLFRM